MSILGGIAGNLASGNIGRAVVSLVLDTAGYNAQLEKARGETAVATGGMESAFSRFKLGAVAAGAVAGAAIVDFAKHAVEAASDEAESLNKARVVFGAASKDVEAFAETSAESFGISKQAALEAAASFGNMLLSAGLTQQAAGDMSVSIVQLAADLASFNNVDPTVALERLRSGLSGQARPLRAFGILLSESSVQQEAYADGIAKVGDTLTEGQKVQARYNLIMKQTGTAQGDFARTSDGLANSQRILHAELHDLTAEAGQALLPAVIDLTHASGDLVETVSPALVEAFRDFGDTITGPIEGLAKLSAAMSDFGGGGDSIITQTATSLQGFNNVVRDLLNPASGADKLMTDLKQTWTSTKAPVEDVTEATGGMTQVAYEAAAATHDLSEKLSSELQDSLQTTSDDIATLGTTIADTFDVSKKKLIQDFREMFKAAARWTQDMQMLKNLDVGLSPQAEARFETWLGSQAPGYIDRFLRLSEQKQDQIAAHWEQTIGRMNHATAGINAATIQVDSSQLALAEARASRLQQLLQRDV